MRFTSTQKINAKSKAKPQSAAVKQLLFRLDQLIAADNPVDGRIWDAAVCEDISAALGTGKDHTLMAALDSLWEENEDESEAYEYLADLIESCVQTANSEDGFVNLFIAVPVLTWSRNQLPIGKTDASTVQAMKHAIAQYWLAKGVQISLGHTLYAPDTLPEGFAATRKLARQYFDDAGLGKDPAYRKHDNEQEEPFLADCRFWLGVLKAPRGEPLFHAQLTADGEIDIAAQETAWREASNAAASKLFTGCAFDVLPPEPYFEACRSAELDIRGYSLQASALMMMSSLELGADQIRAVIAPCWDEQFEEYRISLLTKTSGEVLQGITWPLLGKEETPDSLLAEIQAHLKTLGIQRVRLVDTPLSMDYCDDCGTPLFPDLDEELVHPGSPDEDEHAPKDRVVH